MGNWGNQAFENDAALDIFYEWLQGALFEFRFAIDPENLNDPTSHIEIRAYARIAAAIAGLSPHGEFGRVEANRWKQMAIDGLRLVSTPNESWTENEITEWLDTVKSDLDELVAVASDQEGAEFEPNYKAILEERGNRA